MVQGPSWNDMPTDVRASWVAGLMAQQDAPRRETAARMAPDGRSQTQAPGQASPIVGLPTADPAPAPVQDPPPLQPPPALSVDTARGVDTRHGRGYLVVTADHQPYLGQEIYAVEVPQADGRVANVFTDASGNLIDLEALERQHGFGIAETPAGDPDPATAATPDVPPDTPMIDESRTNRMGHPQVVYPDGSPYLGRELYVNRNAPPAEQLRDKDGKAVTLESIGLGNQPLSDADRTALQRWQITGAAGLGLLKLGVDGLWYRRSLPGLQGRLDRKLAASARFAEGTSVSARMANAKITIAGLRGHAPVPGVNQIGKGIESRRQRLIRKFDTRVQLMNMTAAQEATFRATQRVQTLNAQTTAFKRGESLLGRFKDTPLVGRVAQRVQNNRLTEMRVLKRQLRADEVPVSIGTRVRNTVRGRILPTAMAAWAGYNTYGEVKETIDRWSDPSNRRKWDDVTRIVGGALQTGGALGALSRSNAKAAILTHVGGTVINTVGEAFRD